MTDAERRAHVDAELARGEQALRAARRCRREVEVAERFCAALRDHLRAGGWLT